MRTPFIKSLSTLLLGVLLLAIPAKAQTTSVLDQYVEKGIASNLVLQQKNVALEKAILSLKIANGMFVPSLALIGNYTTGDGGRSIAFPVGDLLNPVYATLNQLTSSDQFPQIENVNQNFFPRNFYDVRVRASVPIVNTDLVFNKKIQHQQQLMQEYEVLIYKRELVKNIKVAYYNYLSANEAKGIYESALKRAEESKRVNESLLNHGKGLPAYILRSESEIENTRAQLIEAEQQTVNAKLYFNFLLNREAAEDISVDPIEPKVFENITGLISGTNTPLQREELFQIKGAAELNTLSLKMKEAFWVPKLSGFADLGAQAEDLRYNQNANYYLIGLQLDMPLFNGFNNRHRIQQSRLDVKSTDLTKNLVQNQVAMNTAMARNSLTSAYQHFLSAQKQVEAAQSYQKLIEKGFKEGVSTFIESIDARNQLTSAHLLLNIKRYQVLMAAAHVERESASYQFK